MGRKSLTALSALALLSTPLAAQAAERAASPVTADEEMVGTGMLVPVAVLVALLVGVLALDGGDDEPVSP